MRAMQAQPLGESVSFSGGNIIVTVFVRVYSELENGALMNDCRPISH